jgi:adhesin transport system outer membrane protein
MVPSIAADRHYPNAIKSFAHILLVALTFIFQNASAQSSSDQKLTLQGLIATASNFYPSILAARYEAQATQQDVAAAERQRWPTVSATVESNNGNVRSSPTRSMQIDQTIWDAGRNTARISESKSLAEIGQLKVAIQQQELSLQIVAAWQNLISAVQRIHVATAALDRLSKYQQQMRRRVQAEASSRIDLELADSRVQQTEVEMASAESSLVIAISRLRQLSGEEDLYARLSTLDPVPTLRMTSAYTEILKTVEWHAVANEHPNVSKARYEYEQAKSRLDAKQAEGWPQLYVRSYQPFGTGPVSSDTSMTTFLGMRYSPGAGFSNFAEQKAISTRIVGAEQSIQTAIREVLQGLQNDREEFINARVRIAVLERSVYSSALVLESYKRQFESGRKQWLDLLNAVREYTQNQYALADAQAIMIGAMHRLQIRMGQEAR